MSVVRTIVRRRHAPGESKLGPPDRLTDATCVARWAPERSPLRAAPVVLTSACQTPFVRPDAVPVVDRSPSTTAAVVRQALALLAGVGVLIAWIVLRWTWIAAAAVAAIGLTGRFLIHPLLSRWDHTT